MKEEPGLDRSRPHNQDAAVLSLGSGRLNSAYAGKAGPACGGSGAGF